MSTIGTEDVRFCMFEAYNVRKNEEKSRSEGRPCKIEIATCGAMYGAPFVSRYLNSKTLNFPAVISNRVIVTLLVRH